MELIDLFLGSPEYDENGKLIRRDFNFKNVILWLVILLIGNKLIKGKFYIQKGGTEKLQSQIIMGIAGFVIVIILITLLIILSWGWITLLALMILLSLGTKYIKFKLNCLPRVISIFTLFGFVYKIFNNPGKGILLFFTILTLFFGLISPSSCTR